MELIHGFESLPPLSKKTAVTIGNFDGVHLGHRKILQFLVKEAKRSDLFSLVLTFSPHPDTILGKDKIRLIQTLEQRVESITNIGVHYILLTPFNREFYALSGKDFVNKILAATLKAQEVVVGENFRFGKNREGDISILRALGSQFRLDVHEIPSVVKNGKTVSSSLIRDLLFEGQIEKANSLLGRHYEIKGKVVRGSSRGKSLGFPTANIKTENEIIPLGAYITEVKVDMHSFPSMTNAGYRPTFGVYEMQIESFLINFHQNLYGKALTIEFIKKIRDEIKFRTPEELTAQLKKDLEVTKAYFQFP